MRTTNKTLALLVLASLSFGAVAQDDVLNSAPIDVDGYLHDKPVTDGELEQIKNEHGKQKNITQLNKEKSKELGKLSGQTEKLLESQDAYIDSKIESQKAIKEFNRKSAENEKKLKCMLEEDTSPECAKWVKKRADVPAVAVVEDRVQTAQAAPVVVAPAPFNDGPLNPFEEIKLIPYAGATNYQGSVEKLETEFAGGLKLESNVAPRLSVGIGANYSQFNTEDFGSNYVGQPYFGGYASMYGAKGRDINFSNMGMEVYSKFFITRGERFRPYIGAGLGYNRMSLKYADNNTYNNFGSSFGNEETTTGYVTGNLTAGSEVLITRSVGLNVEFQYARGLGGGSADNRQNTFNAPDQRRLQELSDELIEANALSVFAGMVVVF